MPNTQEQIGLLEKRKEQTQEELREARARLKTEQTQEDISRSKEALDSILQTGIEVSCDYTTFLEDGYWCPMFCETDQFIQRHKRTIVTYIPTETIFTIKEGTRDFCSQRGREWTTDNGYSDKDPIPAKKFSRVHSEIGSVVLSSLARLAKEALSDYEKFNAGNNTELTEAVAKLVILDRTKKGLKKGITHSAFKYKPYRLGAVEDVLRHYAEYNVYGTYRIPMVDTNTGYDDRRLYFSRDFDVVIDHYPSFFDHNQEKAILLGRSQNTEKLIRKMKRTNVNFHGPGL